MLEVATEMTQLKGVAESELLSFLAPFLESKFEKTEIVKISDASNLLKHKDSGLDNLINLQRINDINGINNFFRIANAKLDKGGSFTGCVETLEQRKTRLFKKFPRGINTAYYS